MKLKCACSVDDRLFPCNVIFKTAYLFTADYYIHMSYQDEHLVKVIFEAKSGVDIREVDKQFCNELLEQMVRYQVSNENRAIRELVIGRALFSSYIDYGMNTTENAAQEKVLEERVYSLEDIAIDWFEENE